MSERGIKVNATHEGIQIIGLGTTRFNDEQVQRIPWAALGIEHVRFADFGEPLDELASFPTDR